MAKQIFSSRFASRLIKAQVYRAMEPGVRDTKMSKLVDQVIVTLILASTGILILESVTEIREKVGEWLRILDWAIVVIFTFEYATRIWCCTADPRYKHPVLGRLKFALTPMALIDLIAILPSLLSFGAFRVLRLLRLIKLGKYSPALAMVIRVIKNVWNDLLATGFVTLVMLMMTSTLMYYAENKAQPEIFESIPHTMWWSIVTLTTVGYGDMYPVTVAGKLLGSAILVIGVGMVALPTGILGAGFVEEARVRRRREQTEHGLNEALIRAGGSPPEEAPTENEEG